MSLFNNALAGASGQQGYQISRSVRLRSSASAYFSRTPASSSNRTTWSFSFWFKRGKLGASQSFMDVRKSLTDSECTNLYINASDVLVIGGAATDWRITTQVFRDPSAWYHCLIVLDTTQATASNRWKLYVNGAQVTSFSTSNDPSLNFSLGFNNAGGATSIGALGSGAASYFDGYLTEVNFIDGQALTPSSFGQNDPVTGVWQPKKYAGTYGTNGFYLNFADNSAATAAAIGKDSSGNGNNWTPNNISVTAGATYDSMLDTPTPYADGGNGRGNYCVLNPLFAGTSSYLTNGNLNASISAANTNVVGTFQIPSSGKWYWEYQITTIAGGGAPMGGIATNASNTPAVFYRTNGNQLTDNVQSAYGATYTTTDVIGVAVDVGGGTITFYKNNVSQGAITYASAGYYPTLRSNVATDVFAINFGQQPFTYTPPTGFMALNTQNLPDSTIKAGNKYFDATVYTGNATARSITNSGAMQPDLVWTKDRTVAADHRLYDSVRGATNRLFSSATLAESADGGSLTAFNSNGFSVGVSNDSNQNSSSYVAWQWKKGATQGFDIVAGTQSASAVPHSLGVKPSMIIVKPRAAAATDWIVTHKSLGANMQDNFLKLNTTAANAVSAGIWGGEPTSSVFYVGSSITGASNTYVAYLFSEVAGFSKFGSYTGNGSTDGPFIYCGFRPRFLLVKNISSGTNDWAMFDSARETYNQMISGLKPNSSNAEYSGFNYRDFLSNGFKLRNGDSDVNTNGSTYIFAAFAENPFKNSLAR